MSIREDFDECFGIRPTNTQAEGEALAEKEWFEKKQETEEDFDTFYKNSTGYIHELVNWNDSARKKRIRPKVIRALTTYFPSVKSILDFGGGTGDDALYLEQQGYQVFYYDINKKMIEFAKYRFKKYNSTIIVVNELPQVDCIMFLDVIEHFHDPFKYLKMFSEKCEAMLFTQAFGIHGDDGKQFPYHTDYKMAHIKKYLENKLDFKKVHIPIQVINTPPHLYRKEIF
jgi:SAM-dependent methyltransferase